MKFVLEINLGNDAMQTYDDIATALFYVHNALAGNAVIANPNEFTYANRSIVDDNGNRVGEWDIKQ